MIKTIIFDLAEVYLNGIIGIENNLKNKLNLKPQKIRTQLTKCYEFEQLMKGKITENEFWKRIVKQNKWNIKITYLKKAIRNNFKEIKGTREIIEKLKEKGFKLGLLSDHSKEWIYYCNKKFNYHKLFHFIQYSFEVESCKTNTKTFKLLLKKLNENTKNCLFIDDNNKYIKVAKSVGLNTIQFKNPKQLKKELKHFSINID